MRVFKGLPISKGIGIGKAVVIKEEVGRITRSYISSENVKKELIRLERGISKSIAQLRSAIKKVDSKRFRDLYLILNTHLMIVEDKSLRRKAEEFIRTEKINAEWAIERVVDELRASFSLLKDRYLRERMSDIDMVAQRVLGNLAGRKRQRMELPHSAVIISHSLSPADFAHFPKKGIEGIGIEVGAYTSHIGIITRALRIPAVFGVSSISKKVKNGDVVIVDGYTGDVYVNPSKEVLKKYERVKETTMRDELIEEMRDVKPVTVDGVRIYVKANVEMLDEIYEVKRAGADGIGIYRTEFFFKEHGTLPSEEVQVRHYKDLLEKAYPLTVNIRTVDIGIEDIENTAEKNPALGLRAIRLLTVKRGILKVQLKSILRAGNKGNVRLLFPMITTVDEILEVKKLLNECRDELKSMRVKKPSQGIMLETPSACMISDFLAKEVDFLSIGTNDLIQYTLAIDRMNEFVAHLYNPLHPSVLRIIKRTVDGALEQGKEVEVCGEIAGDPFYIPVLIGMGVKVVSMIPSAIPHAKKIISKVNVEEMRMFVENALNEKTAKKVEERLKRYYRERKLIV